MIEALKLDETTVSEKLMMMEALWTSLIDNIEHKDFTPSWHLQILKEREEQMVSGEAKFSSFSDVKERLRKRNHAN